MDIFDKYATLDKLIESNMEEIKRLKEMAASIPTIDPSREFISGGPIVQSKFSDLIDKAVDLENELIREIGEYLDAKKELYDILKKISPIHALVLRYRYLDRLTYEEIAEKLGCSVRRVYNLKNAAVKECEEFHFIAQ